MISALFYNCRFKRTHSGEVRRIHPGAAILVEYARGLLFGPSADEPVQEVQHAILSTNPNEGVRTLSVEATHALNRRARARAASLHGGNNSTTASSSKVHGSSLAGSSAEPSTTVSSAALADRENGEESTTSRDGASWTSASFGGKVSGCCSPSASASGSGRTGESSARVATGSPSRADLATVLVRAGSPWVKTSQSPLDGTSEAHRGAGVPAVGVAPDGNVSQGTVKLQLVDEPAAALAAVCTGSPITRVLACVSPSPEKRAGTNDVVVGGAALLAAASVAQPDSAGASTARRREEVMGADFPRRVERPVGRVPGVVPGVENDGDVSPLSNQPRRRRHSLSDSITAGRRSDSFGLNVAPDTERWTYAEVPSPTKQLNALALVSSRWTDKSLLSTGGETGGSSALSAGGETFSFSSTAPSLRRIGLSAANSAHSLHPGAPPPGIVFPSSSSSSSTSSLAGKSSASSNSMVYSTARTVGGGRSAFGRVGAGVASAAPSMIDPASLPLALTGALPGTHVERFSTRRGPIRATLRTIGRGDTVSGSEGPDPHRDTAVSGVSGFGVRPRRQLL